MTGALAGRWVARPRPVWMLLVTRVWSRSGCFQSPRAPGWCRLTGGGVGPGDSGAGPGVGDHWWGVRLPTVRWEAWRTPKLALAARVQGWGPAGPGAGGASGSALLWVGQVWG